MIKNQAHCFCLPHILKQEVMRLVSKVLYPIGTSESCRYAAYFLSRSGFLLTDHPSPDITHLLLDIPSFRAGRTAIDLRELLRMLPGTVTIIGYGLDEDFLETYSKLDLQNDLLFLARNAAITAECALQAAMPCLTTTLQDSPTLILGWGRIGKCLSKLLRGIGAPVTIAARKEADRAVAAALGFRSVDFSGLTQEAARHRLLFNTVPEGITLFQSSPDCVKLDLASLPGLQGCDIIPARGLPGKYAPETSGKLIAETVSRLIKE